MQRWLLMTGLGLVLLAAPALAEEVPLAGGLVMEVKLAPGWTVHREAPADLAAEVAEHLEHEAQAQGKHPTAEQLLAAAKKRLAANEAFLVHASGAYLACDASPLDTGERPPVAANLRQSAEYAGESLGGEEGISNLKVRVDQVALAGAGEAARLTADYRHHDTPKKFIGLIGFAADHWLFLYYTDPLTDPAAAPAMEAMLAGLRIKAAGR